jgi:hypothetical protein
MWVPYLQTVAKGYPEQLGIQYIDIYFIYFLNDPEIMNATLLHIVTNMRQSFLGINRNFMNFGRIA